MGKQNRPACVMHSYSAFRQKLFSVAAWLSGGAAASNPPAGAGMAHIGWAQGSAYMQLSALAVSWQATIAGRCDP